MKIGKRVLIRENPEIFRPYPLQMTFRQQRDPNSGPRQLQPILQPTVFTLFVHAISQNNAGHIDKFWKITCRPSSLDIKSRIYIVESKGVKPEGRFGKRMKVEQKKASFYNAIHRRTEIMNFNKEKKSLKRQHDQLFRRSCIFKGLFGIERKKLIIIPQKKQESHERNPLKGTISNFRNKME